MDKAKDEKGHIYIWIMDRGGTMQIKLSPKNGQYGKVGMQM